jgi:hypothetical protein
MTTEKPRMLPPLNLTQSGPEIGPETQTTRWYGWTDIGAVLANLPNSYAWEPERVSFHHGPEPEVACDVTTPLVYLGTPEDLYQDTRAALARHAAK